MGFQCLISIFLLEIIKKNKRFFLAFLLCSLKEESRFLYPCVPLSTVEQTDKKSRTSLFPEITNNHVADVRNCEVDATLRIVSSKNIKPILRQH